MTLVALLVSTAAVAQIPTLPWNPDGNDDQFIGLPDLLDLLTVYGQEFENAIVAEDGESAIMFIGYYMEYPLCAQACKNLPGIWQLPKIEDLGLVWDEVNSGPPQTWLNPSGSQVGEIADGQLRQLAFYTSIGGYMYTTGQASSQMTCYCTAKQLPRVEYTYCEGTDIQSCADDLVGNGWYPLQGISSHHRFPSAGGSIVGESGYQYEVQAFWRFAQ